MLLKNGKMPTVVRILTFISGINTPWSFVFSSILVYEKLKLYA